MNIPFRLVVLQRLAKLIETAVGEDHKGELFDLTGRVYRGRVEFGNETSLPAVSILEAPTPDIPRTAGEGQASADTWTILIQGWAEDDETNPSDPAYWLAAAVQAKLSEIVEQKDGGRPKYPENYMLGKIITSFEMSPYVVRPVDARASSRAFFYLPVRVGLARNVSQPYLSV